MQEIRTVDIICYSKKFNTKRMRRMRNIDRAQVRTLTCTMLIMKVKIQDSEYSRAPIGHFNVPQQKEPVAGQIHYNCYLFRKNQKKVQIL